MIARALLLSLWAVMLALPASAAGETGLQLRPVVGGQTLSCTDFRGKAVRTYLMVSLGDVARASYVNRMPIIFLDEQRLETLPDALKLFFYQHECAHLVLGHYFYRTVESENEADCWAIREGRRLGFFNRLDVDGFAPHFAHSKGSAMGHLPGPDRARRLVECYDEPGPAPAEVVTGPETAPDPSTGPTR